VNDQAKASDAGTASTSRSLADLGRLRLKLVQICHGALRMRGAPFHSCAPIRRTEDATREGRLLDRVECSREFYKLLAASTGNKVIAMIMDSVTEIHMRFVYAKVSSSGVAMARLAEKRRQFVAALGARNVATATRLMRIHLESVQRMLEQDPGAMSLHVALAEVQPGMRR
jgi:GntR family transcriptional repressor for pyruvate dehydrogenase complex